MLSRRGAGNRAFYHGEQMIKSVNPENSPENEKTHRWTYNDVPPMSSHRGWVAGKPFGAYLHFLGRKSEPCRERMTGSALACPHCAVKIKSAWRGYVPYYDEEYVRRFVLISEDYLESVEELEHLAPVVIQRGKSKTDPVIVRQKLWRTTPLPHSAERSEPVNLARFCVLVLWGDDILLAWDNAERKKASASATTPKPTKKSAPPTSAERLKGIIEQTGNAPQDGESLGETYTRIIQHFDKSKNGKHTKTDE